MVEGGLVLGEIVFQIVLSSHPIYQKFSLPASASDPVKSHVDFPSKFLEDVVAYKSNSCGYVCHC